MRAFRLILMSVCSVATLFAPLPSSAQPSGSCASVTAGARNGPSPNWDRWPYGDGCYVDWPGGHSAERDKFERQCQNLSGAEFVAFSGDFGSGRNTCIFRPSNNARGTPSGGAPSCENLARQAPAFDRMVTAIARKDWAEVDKAAGEVRLFLIRVRGTCQSRAEAAAEFYACYSLAAFTLNVPAPKAELRDLLQATCKNSTTDFVQEAIRKAASAANVNVRPSPPPAPPQEVERSAPGDRFGALALTPNGVFFGWSSNNETAVAARAEALANCKAYQDNTISTGYDTREKCKIVTIQKNACLSTARADPGYWYWSWNSSKVEADKDAIARCRSEHSTGCRRSPDAQFCTLAKATGGGGEGATPQRTADVQARRSVTFRVCNQYPSTAFVLGRFRRVGDAIDTLEGWWKVEPGECAMLGSVVPGLVYHYAHARNDSGGRHIWSSNDAVHCAVSEAFARPVQPVQSCDDSRRRGLIKTIARSDRSEHTIYLRSKNQPD